VRNLVIEAEISRERVPLRNAYRAPGQRARVRALGNVERTLAGGVIMCEWDCHDADTTSTLCHVICSQHHLPYRTECCGTHVQHGCDSMVRQHGIGFSGACLGITLPYARNQPAVSLSTLICSCQPALLTVTEQAPAFPGEPVMPLISC
jgi:hypothetical protein